MNCRSIMILIHLSLMVGIALPLPELRALAPQPQVVQSANALQRQGFQRQMAQLQSEQTKIQTEDLTVQAGQRQTPAFLRFGALDRANRVDFYPYGPPVAQQRNRYENVGPSQGNAIVLQTAVSNELLEGLTLGEGEDASLEGTSTYVNASLMTPPEGLVQQRYIAAQAPPSAAMRAFWQMIWEQQVGVITMVSNEREQGRIKVDRYWPNPGETLRYEQMQIVADQVQEELNEMGVGWRLRTFRLRNGREPERVIRQMQYVGWPDHGAPVDVLSFINFRQRVRQQLEVATGEGLNGPNVVHCSAGCGRSGVFVVFDALSEALENGRIRIDQVRAQIDPFFAHYRHQRSLFVQVAVQYEFLHRALVSYLAVLEQELSRQVELLVQQEREEVVVVPDEDEEEEALGDQEVQRRLASLQRHVDYLERTEREQTESFRRWQQQNEQERQRRALQREQQRRIAEEEEREHSREMKERLASARRLAEELKQSLLREGSASRDLEEMFAGEVENEENQTYYCDVMAHGFAAAVEEIERQKSRTRYSFYDQNQALWINLDDFYVEDDESQINLEAIFMLKAALDSGRKVWITHEEYREPSIELVAVALNAAGIGLAPWALEQGVKYVPLDMRETDGQLSSVSLSRQFQEKKRALYATQAMQEALEELQTEKGWDDRIHGPMSKAISASA